MKVFLEAFLQTLKPTEAVIELKKFTTVKIDDLWNLQSQVNDNALSLKLVTEINKLQKLLPKTEDVQGGYKGLTHYDKLPGELNDYLDLAKGILQNLTNAQIMEGTMDGNVTPAVQELLIQLLNLGDGSVNAITEKVLPCSSIHYIATSLIATGCSKSGLNNRFFGWALALILTVLFTFLSFVELFNLWCFQSRQIRYFYGS
ncbi:unnamed protein product [Hymenolepis diminuta]|uniref:MitMem_reg domain-containing protein n=1 Tax=Hymenolepis diminuta TaxID=6216 RepID=A0A0R3SZ14_HYMDI|nr:unnamed protein product [Hymenolepis diminuta]